MKIDIFIFRHGQTDKNVAQVWQGCKTNAPLNTVGEKQAEELAERFKHQPMQMYCSPLTRAIQTAQKIMQKNTSGNGIKIRWGLRECDFGDAEGMPLNDTEKRYNIKIEHLLFPTEETADLHFPNGESKRDVFYRVYDCLLHIVSDAAVFCPEKSIGIVCHAGVLSALEFGLKLKNVSFENCAVLHLQYDTVSRSFTQLAD